MPREDGGYGVKVVVNIAYCQQHHKGGDGIGTLPGVLHAEWLEKAVEFYNAWAFGQPPPLNADVFVSITGFPGWTEVEAGRERDALWRTFKHARFVTMGPNPGHQVGAAWCARLGLEAAGKLGYDALIHTAEDVVPEPGSLREMVEALADADYAGEAWGPEQNELNTQFFGARVPYLAGVFDPTKIPEHGHIERYMAWLLRDRPVCRKRFPYAHTHDFADWTRRVAARRAL